MTPTKRILIASPLKGSASPRYVYDVVAALMAKLPEFSFDFRILDGAPVGWARNELAHDFMRSKCDELVFIDADVPFRVDQLVRLCSHQVPIVCGLYAARSLDTVWLAKGIRGEEPDAAGLIKVGEAPLGFSKITKEAFDAIAAAHPDKVGLYGMAGQKPVLMQDFFPLGLTGANTAEARVANMRALFKSYSESATAPAAMTSRELIEFVDKMERLLSTQYPEKNVFRGEDYAFCSMARAAGIDVLLDAKLALPHEDMVALPIPTEQLQKMLTEPWRGPDLVKAEATP